VSPKARRLAKEHDVDLATLQGSGPEGEIIAEDVLTAGRTYRADPAADEAARPRVEGSTVARLMAERTTEGWTTVPHFFVSRDVDAAGLVAAREPTAGVSHTDVLVSSVARTLARHPQMNASWIDGRVRLNRDVNVAIAISVEDAVVAGVIHGADARSLTDIASRRKELASRARAGRLQPADITGATFTISNLGMFRVDAFTAIIVPPQAGILAVGAIRDRVAVLNGQAAVRPAMTLTLSCDHRVIDGARAARFLDDVVSALDERR
jgi:pyruvate dehydrogenase E2 component (dihydrolipoamide acetyltransferase)